MADAVRIALIFPSLLGTYGDGGNASVLAQRLRWRGHAAEVIDVGIDDPVPGSADLYVFGGGEDAAQTLAVSRLADGTLAGAVARGATVFAVCAGFQILGETFLDGHGGVHTGLGLLDARTDRLDGPRAVGELLVDSTLRDVGLLTGYENHGGRTTLGPGVSPLGAVRAGTGNGDTGADGAVAGGVVATYLHGPVLARNPALADWLLTTATGLELTELDDSDEIELRRERIGAVTRAATVGRWSRLRARQWRPPAQG